MHMFRHLIEKVWTTVGPEFGKHPGKTAVIFETLYGLNLPRWMESIGYESCEADSNLWLKPEIRLDDGV